MKSLLLSIILLCTTKAFALDFKTKGFFAFDTFSLQKVNDEQGRIEWGIGTIDLKFYFNHENFSSKIKLDLDGSLDDSNALYEEATVKYHHSKNVKFTIGKGVIPFHQKRYGMLESSYIDGGSILNTFHNFRDQDRKILLQADYGSYSKGFKNKLALYASSKQPVRDRDDELDTEDLNPEETSASSKKFQIVYETEKSINSKYEKGLVNKFEIYPFNGMKVAIAGLYLDREIDLHKNYAADLSFRYRSDAFELWGEYVYAFVSNSPVDQYAAAKQVEQIVQLGMEYRLTGITSYVINIEGAWVNKQEHNNDDLPSVYAAGTKFYNANNRGQKSEFNTYKIDTGLNFKMAKRVSLKVGIMYERKYTWKHLKHLGYDFGYAGFEKAIQLGSGVSYWF